jgi:hypothetical protein
MVFVFIYIYWCPTRFFHIRWCTSRLTVIRRVSLVDYILYCNFWPLYCLSFFWFLLGYLQTMRAYKTILTPPHFNKVSAQREESEFFLPFFYWILELFRQCGIFCFSYFQYHFTFQLTFLPYFPYLFTIQLTCIPYLPYLFFIVSNDSFKSELSSLHVCWFSKINFALLILER